MCAHLGRSCGLRRNALTAARPLGGPVPQHVDRYFWPHLAAAEVLSCRSGCGHSLQDARPPEHLKDPRAYWRNLAKRRSCRLKFGRSTGPICYIYFRRAPDYIAGTHKTLTLVMAGHSQFKNIMHKKGRADKARSKLFGKLAREITVAAKLGMPDPAFNPRLRAAVLAARAENMPKDNIERAITKSQRSDTENYDQIRYEGYAPG